MKTSGGGLNEVYVWLMERKVTEFTLQTLTAE